MRMFEKVFGKQTEARDQDGTESEKMRMEAAHVIKFIILEFAGDWERRSHTGMADTLQYEVVMGPRISRAAVVLRSDDGMLKTYRYEFKTGDIVLVIGDIVHLPKQRISSEDGNTL